MSIKIIGAGFPRTGTTTLKRALEELGYSKTFHMKELILNPHKLKYWKEIQKFGTTNWEKLYMDYQATVDFPCYPFYKIHMKKYPDAKVILTYRPFDKWYNSAYNTVWQAGPQTIPEKLSMLFKMTINSRLRKVVNCIKFFHGIFWTEQFNGKFEDKAAAKEIYEEYIKQVKAYVPAEKLLVYHVEDGWGPLCNFLNIEQPKNEFPHLNKKENFKSMLNELMKGNIA